MFANEDRLRYQDGLVKEQLAIKAVDDPLKKVNFQDFLSKKEILRAIVDCEFENLTEVQRECIPHAVLGLDVLCQAAKGTGKIALFVLATLDQLKMDASEVSVLVLCSYERAKIIYEEYLRLSKYMTTIKVALITSGVHIVKQEKMLQDNCPQIVVGTLGRVLQLVERKELNLRYLNHFVLDGCDHVLGTAYLLRDVKKIISHTNQDKQVMMFTRTLTEEMRPVCKKLMQQGRVEYVNKVTTVS